MSKRNADPVIVEVVRNLLMSIAEETNTVIIKSAYSTNIKERRDNTTAIMDPAGNVVVQVESSIPMLLAALLFAARGVVSGYRPEDIHPGDMFIVNDPYHGGGNHLPDITVVAPVFMEEKIIGWIGNTAHHSDIGGKVPGFYIRGCGQSVPGGNQDSNRENMQGRESERGCIKTPSGQHKDSGRAARGSDSSDKRQPDWCSEVKGGL